MSDGNSEDVPRRSPVLRLLPAPEEEDRPNPVPPASTRQLMIPGTEGMIQGALILLSFRNLLRLGIEQSLARFKPSVIVDVRIAPTFVPYRSVVDDFIRELQALGIDYWHEDKLAPGALGQDMRLEEYTRQLRGHADILKRLGQYSLKNTVLLISSDPRTRGSDRDALVGELLRSLGRKRSELKVVLV